MKTIPKRSFGSLKPKDNKKASIDIKDPDIEKQPYSEKVDLKYITEQIFKDATISDFPAGKFTVTTAKTSKTKLTSVRLMTIFELLTDKSFPRKGPGKSTKVKILDAIIMAAIDKKLILQEEKDVKSKNH